MLGNALLIAVVYKNANQRMRTPNNYFILNMACADVFLTVYALSTLQIATSGLSWESQESCFVDYHSLLVIIFNVSLSLHCKFACDCSKPFFPGVLSTQENNNNSYRPVSDWRHLDFCDSVHGAVIQNDHFSRIQAGLPCLYLQFWNHWLRYHLFIILLPCGGITAYHCYHPNLRCDWIQTETHHSTRQPTPVKSTSTGTDEPQDINNACHCCCCANRLSFSVDFWNDGLFLWLKNCLLLELSVPWLVSGML